MYRTNIQLRFRDTDGMGHVNNAVFLTYLELARIEFFKEFFDVNKPQDISFILVRVEIDFKRPITLKDEIAVVLWVKSIGNTSWLFEYKIIDSNNSDIIFSEAKSAQIVFNYDTNKKEIIPPKFKAFLEKNIK